MMVLFFGLSYAYPTHAVGVHSQLDSSQLPCGFVKELVSLNYYPISGVAEDAPRSRTLAWNLAKAWKPYLVCRSGRVLSPASWALLANFRSRTDLHVPSSRNPAIVYRLLM